MIDSFLEEWNPGGKKKKDINEHSLYQFPIDNFRVVFVCM